MKSNLFLTLSVIIFSALTVLSQTQQTTPNQEQIPCQVIRKVNYPVTQTRPSSQPLKIALLNLCPENPGQMARPMLPFMIDGKVISREYDVVKVFKTEKDARKYAKKNKINDVSF